MDTIVCSRDTLGIPWDLWPLKKLKTPNGIAASPSQLVGPFGPCSWMVSQWLAPAVCWSRAPVSLLACMQNNLAFWGCLIFWVIPVTTQQLLNGNAFSTLMAPQRNIWLSMKKTYSPFGGRPDPPPHQQKNPLISTWFLWPWLFWQYWPMQPTPNPNGPLQLQRWMSHPHSFLFLPHLYDLIQLIQNQLITIMSILDFTPDVNHFVFDFSEFFM